MKQFLKFSTFLIILFSFVSCKKENTDLQSNQASALEPQNKPEWSVLNRINVHANGFLVFAKRNDLLEYSKLINSPSKELTLKYLSSKGFEQKPANLSITSREGDDPYATVFDSNGLLQVEDILMKISNDEKFFYIVKEQNLDPAVYTKLLAELYDELKMNKINVDRVNENFNMFAVIDYTPFGINEPLITTAEKRPCIGTGVVTHNMVNGCHYTCLQNYFLWIPVGPEFACTAATGCGGAF